MFRTRLAVLVTLLAPAFSFAGGKMSARAAVFHIKWDDLQLNVPNPFVPGQFYIANVGRARSRGLEMELAARPVQGVDLFATFGFTSARSRRR